MTAMIWLMMNRNVGGNGEMIRRKRLQNKRDIADTCEVKADIGGVGEVLLRHGESIGARIEKMEVADLRYDHQRPAPAAAADIDAVALGGSSSHGKIWK